MRKFGIFFAIILSVVGSVSAQTEDDLKRYFEGKLVTVRIDMPATKDGVNIYPERDRTFDYGEYASRIKRYGVSVRRGETIMITKIKVKNNHIEFQLGGGGYGTAGDETDSAVYVPPVAKSRRERKLEDELARETDPKRRKRLKDDLDDLRRSRERQDQINQAIAAEERGARQARIEQKALQGGSRFNVHISVADSATLTPGTLIEALRPYVEFSARDLTVLSQAPYPYLAKQGVIRVGTQTTYLKNGLKTLEVVGLLGEPVTRYTRDDQGTAVTTLEFNRSGGRVLVAEFIGNVWEPDPNYVKV